MSVPVRDNRSLSGTQSGAVGTVVGTAADKALKDRTGSSLGSMQAILYIG